MPSRAGGRTEVPLGSEALLALATSAPVLHPVLPKVEKMTGSRRVD